MPPKVSLVTVVYNCEKYIAQAVESVIRQSYDDFEYIIIDGQSIDRTFQIISDYTHDKRIKLYSQPNKGHVEALKNALYISKGEYLGVLDADDTLHKDCLKETVELLEKNPDTGMVYTSYKEIDENDKTIRQGVRNTIRYSKERLLIDFMTFHFRLIKSDIYDLTGGYRPEFIGAEDYDLCLRISEIAKIQHLKKVLYNYRKHDESFTAKKPEQTLVKSLQAIREALIRRSMNDKYELKVSLKTQLELVEK